MIGMVLSSISAFLLLALGVTGVWRQRTAPNAVLFCAAVLLAGIEIFDQLSLQFSPDFAMSRWISLTLESLLPGTFLFLSLTYGRSTTTDARSRGRLGLALVPALFPVVMMIVAGSDFSYSPDFPGERVLFLGNMGYWYYLAIMCLLIISLVNVEATFAATRGLDRYRMKFESIGIMSLLAVLIFYYSQGLLYRTINMNLVPIRSSVLIIAAFLIGYSQVFRGSGGRVSVSRHIFYRSIALLVVGIYLITLGLIGEGMRYFDFGRDLTIVFAFAGGVAVLIVLFSETVRRKTKVYISKHFYAHKHDYREEWIKFTNRLSSCASLHDVQEAVLAVYRETFGLRGAALYLLSRDEKRYIRASEHAMPESPAELSVSEGLYAYFVKRERVLDVTDGEYPLSTAELEVFRRGGTWLVVPLISSGKIEGLAVFREQIVAERLTYDDYDLMKVLARQAAQAITNLRLSEELMEVRAMAAVSRISTFVIHDLKNLTSGLSLVVDNAQEHIGNPEFQQDAVTTIKNTLSKMKNLIQRLKTIPEKTALTARVEDIDRLSGETIAELAKMRPGELLVYRGCNGASAFSRVDGEEIKKVIVNLVQNAFEASSEGGAVTVETRKENGGVCIRVIDSGCGMTEDFMKNHLFKPFRTTKDKGLGIGLYQCRQIVEAHGGRLESESATGKGTVFTICLPVAEADTNALG